MASKSPLAKYTSYLIYAGVFLGIISSLGMFYWHQNMHPLWFILLLFMIGVQWLVIAFTVKFGQHKTSTLLKQYQIAKYAKLFIYLILLIIYMFGIKANIKAFAINFMVYYLFFTALEAWFFHKWMNTLPKMSEKL
jgi:hypothetical protein